MEPNQLTLWLGYSAPFGPQNPMKAGLCKLLNNPETISFHLMQTVQDFFQLTITRGSVQGKRASYDGIEMFGGRLNSVHRMREGQRIRFFSSVGDNLTITFERA